MRKITSGLVALLLLSALAVSFGCGAGGVNEPKVPGPETIRSTPNPNSGFGSPPLPP